VIHPSVFAPQQFAQLHNGIRLLVGQRNAGIVLYHYVQLRNRGDIQTAQKLDIYGYGVCVQVFALAYALNYRARENRQHIAASKRQPTFVDDHLAGAFETNHYPAYIHKPRRHLHMQLVVIVIVDIEKTEQRILVFERIYRSR